MTKNVRWGIIGTGGIARKFATGLQSAEGASLVAVGSRTAEGAEKFGGEFDVPNRHASYEALAADQQVDAVYIATPHPMHKRDTMLCLNAGKAVLCEKPFAINAGEAIEMVALAREKNLLLMEAMWTRFLPLTVKLRELLAEGAIGEVRMLSADFGFRCGGDPSNRLMNPDLGGGALLDVGIYTISLASMILGRPTDVTGLAHMGETGVDEQSAMLLKFEGGELAVLSTAVRTTTPQEATVIGTEGHIRLHSPWWAGVRMTVTAGGQTKDIDMPFEGNGYNYEAEEIARCLDEGKTESDVIPLDESISLIQTMDRLREQWGLKYPME